MRTQQGTARPARAAGPVVAGERRPVLVAFSSSAASAAALRRGMAEASDRGLPLWVLHVDDRSERADLSPGADERPGEHGGGDLVADRVGRTLAGRVLDDEPLPAVDVSVLVRTGRLVEVLLEAAREASLLVVGAPSTPCRHVELPRELQQSAACDVLVVPARS